MSFKLSAVVFAATEPSLFPELSDLCGSLRFFQYDAEKMLEPISPAPEVILCFGTSKDTDLTEIAQTLRMNYRKIPIFFLASEFSGFDKKKLIKNGFSHVFLLPWEKQEFLSALKEESFYLAIPELKDYCPVKVIDLEANALMEFSLKAYLPVNNRIIPFCTEGLPLESSKLEKLKESSINTLFIHKDDLGKFREHTSKVLARQMRPNALSETERQEKLKAMVRELMSEFFVQVTEENTFGKSQALLKDLREIIRLLIKEGHPDVITKLESMIGQESGFYIHLSNVATYAGIFGVALEIEKPDDLALAGMLHDIGKVLLPPEFAEMDQDQLGPHALEAYKQHTEKTLEIIRLKRLGLSDKVMAAIQQHHEGVNGTGFPRGLQRHQISKEGKVLAIANAFDHVTSLRRGHKRFNFRQGLEQLFEENTKDPGRMILDIDLLRELKLFFLR